MNVVSSSRPGRAAQRGVATLVVVVLIYVAMALTVVFANRSLIFEQKTSANQYRSTLAIEAAEAGLEWATAMLNAGGTIGTDCQPATGASTASFKNKYLTVDPVDGELTAKVGATHAACVTNQLGAGWTCSCPAAGTTPSPTAPATATGFNPAFSVLFTNSPTTGTVNVTAYGCTTTITGTTCGGDAAAAVTVTLGQLSGLATPPAAPLTARGSVNIGNAALGVHNGTPSTNGITINAGLGIDARSARISTVPGTPPTATLVGNDSSLATSTEDQMFQAFFKVPKAQYKAISHVITGCPCDESDLIAAYNDGKRQIWVDGDLDVNANVTIGDEDDPIILVTDGDVHFNGDIELYGVVYSTGMTWDNTGGGSALITGAAISEGNYAGNGTPDYYYDPNVLSRLRTTLTSFVRVPGSWRDF